ncbi:nucleoside deaminase [Paracoccus sp. (in: a-proteobacteria)]|uniref:nucleoside deaminase n=1 Tax=Paracoccus sp. TaxID=267 RepID=UPI00321FA6C6
MQDEARRYLEQSIALAQANVAAGGEPFGAVLVRGGEVIATGVNETAATHDPTAHAEMVALRSAARRLGSPDLSGCTVYASGHPCPMCLAAMRISGVDAVLYAYSDADSAAHGLSTAAIYEDLARPFAQQTMRIGHLPVRLAGVDDLYGDWLARQPGR